MKKLKFLILAITCVFTLTLFFGKKNHLIYANAADEVSEIESISNLDSNGNSDVTSDLSISESSELQESQSAAIQESPSTNESVPVVDSPNESEDDVDKAALEKIIDNLKGQLEKYKSVVENDTLKAIINALISFVTAFGALWLKFRSFDKANLSLNTSQKLLEITKSEINTLTKDITDLAKNVNNSESTSKGLTELFGKSVDTLNSAIIRLTDRIDELETQVNNKEGK